MSGDLVLHSADEAFVLADRISKSMLVPQAYRGKPADTAIAMLYGAECGLPPMTSLQRIVVVNGKPSMDAQGMVALIRQAGHSVTGDLSPTEAKVVGKRGDNGDTMTSTYTIEDAKTAGLVKSGSPWEKFAEDMLWARAVSRLGRRLFADVLLGVSYVPEEAEAIPVNGSAAPVPPAQVEPVPVVTRRDPPPQVEETGEIVDAEIVDPDADAAMHELAEVIRSIEDDEARARLTAHLRATFGESKLMTPSQIEAATNIAAGWGPESVYDAAEGASF